MNPATDRIRKMLEGGADSALLRFALGNACLDTTPDIASVHFEHALRFDPRYSAAWKMLGKARLACGDQDAARKAWETGIEIAIERGDKQAEKEMRVFLKRLGAAITIR